MKCQILFSEKLETICMKCQNLFSGKNKKSISAASYHREMINISMLSLCCPCCSHYLLLFQSPSFSRCHRSVPADAFYSSCVYDLCACSNETACLCDILSSYAKECAKAGVRLEWRSSTLCGKILCQSLRNPGQGCEFTRFY